MYVWFWRRLPGPTPVRVLLALLAFTGVVALLFFVVFPRLDGVLPLGDVTVGSGSAGPSAAERD